MYGSTKENVARYELTYVINSSLEIINKANYNEYELPKFLSIRNQSNLAVIRESKIEEIENYEIKVTKATKNNSIVNIGSGKNISIKKLANLINKILNKNKKILFDKNKPDGVYNKILCSNLSKKNTHWRPKISLEMGLKDIISKKIISEKL